MSELREILDEAMRAVIPGEPPVDAAMRRGKAIRRRRRVTAVASAVAVAVIAAVGYPAVTHWRALPAPPPVTHTHHVVVTDIPPGKGAAPGLVASGVIGKRSWQVLVSKPGPIGTAQNQQCVYTKGSAFTTGATAGSGTASRELDCGPALTPGTDPVTFAGGSAGPNQAQIGAVTADVRDVVVQLDDGQELRLIPVRVYGIRLVAFATPLATVASATAYLDNGPYLTAVPADLPAGHAITAVARGGDDGRAFVVGHRLRGPVGHLFQHRRRRVRVHGDRADDQHRRRGNRGQSAAVRLRIGRGFSVLPDRAADRRALLPDRGRPDRRREAVRVRARQGADAAPVDRL